MTIQLDPSLVFQTKRRTRDDGLTDDECIALNLFWRKRVKVSTLARVFKVSKNTIYYRALTGTADSYPNSLYTNKAKDVNALIDKMGVDAAWDKFVTDDMVRRVNAEMAEEVRRRDEARAA